MKDEVVRSLTYRDLDKRFVQGYARFHTLGRANSELLSKYCY